MQKEYGERVYELAIYFSRMWGIVETMKPLPNIGFEKIRDKVTEWAEECIADNEQDYVDFFMKKIKKELLSDK